VKFKHLTLKIYKFGGNLRLESWLPGYSCVRACSPYKHAYMYVRKEQTVDQTRLNCTPLYKLAAVP